MELKPYQMRVVAEKAELDEKREKLKDFLFGADGIDPNERARLNRQARIMDDYSDVLGERIKAFGG